MFEPEVVTGPILWVPPEKRQSRFGGPMPPRKPETRTPALWVYRWNDELFLVNASGEALASVSSSVVGFISADEVTLATEPNTLVTYLDVRPGDAVKVEEYDGFLDLDYVLGVNLTIESDGLGLVEIHSPMEKGGIAGEAVLLWRDGSAGKNVSIQTIRRST